MSDPLHTPKIVRLSAPSPRERRVAAADEHLLLARVAVGRAVAAGLAGRHEADALTREAIISIDRARAELAALSDADLDALNATALAKLSVKP